jgi:hypothetical protein
MSTPQQPVPSPATFEAQSLHVTRRPDENLAMLSRVEFTVLKDGEVSEARAGRDLFVGFLGSAIVGFLGLIATIDWDATFRMRNWAPFIWTGLLFAVALAAATGAFIYNKRYKRTVNSTAYSDLMKRLSDHFGKEDRQG